MNSYRRLIVKGSFVGLALFLYTPGLSLAQTAPVGISNIRVDPPTLDLNTGNRISVGATLTSAYGVSRARFSVSGTGISTQTFDLYNDGKHNDGGAQDEQWAGTATFSAIQPGTYQVVIRATARNGETTSSAPVTFTAVKPEQTKDQTETDRATYEESIRQEEKADNATVDKAVHDAMTEALHATATNAPSANTSGAALSLWCMNAKHRYIQGTCRNPSAMLRWQYGISAGTCTASAEPNSETASQFWSGQKNSNGYAYIEDPSAVTTYTLTCTNSEGQSSASVTVIPPGDGKSAIPVVSSGNTKEKLDVLFVGEGYSKDDLVSLVKQLYGYSFASYSPFKENIVKINIWALQGQNVFTPTDPNDIYYNHYYYALNARTYNAFADKIVFISPNYFRSYAYFDGDAFVSYAYAGDTKETGATVMHELGHSFGGLADEYIEYPYPSYAVDPNCKNPSAKPAAWGAQDNSFHSSRSQSGLVEQRVETSSGCSYTPDNIRATPNSVMRSQWGGGRPFGPVNEQELLTRLFPYTPTPKEKIALFSPATSDSWPLSTAHAIRWVSTGPGVTALELVPTTGNSSSKTLYASKQSLSGNQFIWIATSTTPGDYTIQARLSGRGDSITSPVFRITAPPRPNQVLQGVCAAISRDYGDAALDIASGKVLIAEKEYTVPSRSPVGLYPHTLLEIYAAVDPGDTVPYFVGFDPSSPDAPAFRDYYTKNGVRLHRITAGDETVYGTGQIDQIEHFFPGCVNHKNNLSLTVSTPNGGERFTNGSVEKIIWKDVDVTSHSYDISIPNFGYLGRVTAGISFDWTVGSYEEGGKGGAQKTLPGGTYTILVRRSDGSAQDASNAPFTILGSDTNVVLSGMCTTNAGADFVGTGSGAVSIGGKKISVSGKYSGLHPSSIINLYALNIPRGADNVIFIGAYEGDSAANTAYAKDGVLHARVTTGPANTTNGNGAITNIQDFVPGCPNTVAGSAPKSPHKTQAEDSRIRILSNGTIIKNR